MKELFLEDLTITLLMEWNDKILQQDYNKSFDFFIKTRYPKSYKKIIDEVKYFEWSK